LETSVCFRRIGEADHSRPSSAEVKDQWNYAYMLPICLQGTHRNHFTCTHHKPLHIVKFFLQL